MCGRDVLVIPYTEATRSASHASSTTYTCVVARIDPPLFLGMKLEAPRPMDPIFGPKFNPLTGDPELDRVCGITATKHGAAAHLLRRASSPPNDLLDHLHALADRGRVLISDSAVHFRHAYDDDPAAIGPWLTSVAAVAAHVAARRGTLPSDAGEAALLATWRGVADAERLAFDDARLAISGSMGGVQVRLGVETEGTEGYTLLSLEAPRSLGLGLRLSKQGALQFVAGWFGSQDVKVGDPAFDDAFVVKASAEPSVKALLASNPAARHALVGFASHSTELVLDDERLVVRWPGIADGAALQGALVAARAIAPVLAPSHRAPPAYR